MKAPQQTGGRTDQMLGAMGDILTSLALPSQPWVRFEGTRQWEEEHFCKKRGSLLHVTFKHSGDNWGATEVL